MKSIASWLVAINPVVDAVVQVFLAVTAATVLAAGLATLAWLAVDQMRSRHERRKFVRHNAELDAAIAARRTCQLERDAAPKALAPARQPVDQQFHQPRIKVTSARQEVAP